MGGVLRFDGGCRLRTTVAGWLGRRTDDGIRRRTTKDLGACARLLRIVSYQDRYPYHWPDAPRAWLSDGDVIDAWVAEHLGQLLGHVAISRVGTGGVSEARWREITARDPSELAAVSRLFVRPRNRGAGIGAALLKTATDEIRGRGLTPVLEVVSINEAAINLYVGQGWRLLAMDPWGPNAERLRVFCYAGPKEPAPVESTRQVVELEAGRRAAR
ncbi:MAG: GNAT family N-acetyltransferase [Nocardioidaceae bacterium]